MAPLVVGRNNDNDDNITQSRGDDLRTSSMDQGSGVDSASSGRHADMRRRDAEPHQYSPHLNRTDSINDAEEIQNDDFLETDVNNPSSPEHQLTDYELYNSLDNNSIASWVETELDNSTMEPKEEHHRFQDVQPEPEEEHHRYPDVHLEPEELHRFSDDQPEPEEQQPRSPDVQLEPDEQNRSPCYTRLSPDLNRDPQLETQMIADYRSENDLTASVFQRSPCSTRADSWLETQSEADISQDNNRIYSTR